jgi:uncharacterized protein YybS (DUF2232 family)
MDCFYENSESQNTGFNGTPSKENLTVVQTDKRGVSKDILTGTAITLIILATSVKLPVMGFFCSLFLPLPILFYRSKLGRTTGLVVPVVSLILMIAVTGRFSVDIMFFVELLLLGYLLSELFELDMTVEKTILYACGGILLAGFVGLILYSNLSGTTLYGLVSAYVAANLEMTLALYESMGVSEESIYNLDKSLDQIRYVLIRILPAMIIVSSLFVTWSNLLIAKPLFKKKGLFFPDFGTLNLWKAPDSLIWFLIACGALLLVPAHPLKIIGLNGLLVILMIYFFQGIAVVSFFFEKKKFPRFLRLIFYSLIALQQIFLLFIIGIGLFDMWMNFRKLNLNNNQ